MNAVEHISWFGLGDLGTEPPEAMEVLVLGVLALHSGMVTDDGCERTCMSEGGFLMAFWLLAASTLGLRTCWTSSLLHEVCDAAG